MEDQLLQDQKTEKDDLITETAPAEDLAMLREMMAAGLMYGHKKSKTNPKFRPYIYTTRNGIEIIDLTETLAALERAIEFLGAELKSGGTVLVVATQPAAQEAIRKLTEKFNFSYVEGRWIGGLLTNFKVISKRIEYFKKLKADALRGRLDKYTKKERGLINRDIERMRKIFAGVENMEKLPSVVFVVDAAIKNHKTALREAKRLKIKTVGIIDSDDNPEAVDCPIPANDHAKSSIDWIISRIVSSLESVSNKSLE